MRMKTNLTNEEYMKVFFDTMRSVYTDLMDISYAKEEKDVVNQTLAINFSLVNPALVLTPEGLIASESSVVAVLSGNDYLRTFFINMTSLLVLRLATKTPAVNINGAIDRFTAGLTLGVPKRRRDALDKISGLLTSFLRKPDNLGDIGYVFGPDLNDDLEIDPKDLNFFFKSNHEIFVYILFYIQCKDILEIKN